MQTITAARTELWRHRLPRPVGGSGVASVDVLIVELESAGAAGLGFSYVLGGDDELPLAAARRLLERFAAPGTTAGHPQALWRRIAGSLGRTGGGPYCTALAALDVAAWDLYARRLGVPLGVAMGGSLRRVPVYGSGGFTAGQDPLAAAEVARAYGVRGVRAVKPRASGTPDDAALLAAVAGAVDVPLMVDANERCSPLAAARLVHEAAAVGALFVEEPLPSSDLAGYRALARGSPVPLATGEHHSSSAESAPYLLEGLCRVIQPDLRAMGGLTECLRTAALAEHAGVEVAPHFLPGLFVHLAAAAPNVTWLEDFPLLEPLFTGMPVMAADGTMGAADVPGHGLQIAEGVRESFRIA